MTDNIEPLRIQFKIPPEMSNQKAREHIARITDALDGLYRAFGGSGLSANEVDDCLAAESDEASDERLIEFDLRFSDKIEDGLRLMADGFSDLRQALRENRDE